MATRSWRWVGSCRPPARRGGWGCPLARWASGDGDEREGGETKSDEARRIVYALTDRRAITITPSLIGSRMFQSFGPEFLPQLSRVERANGCGDLVFRRLELNYQTSRSWPQTATAMGFLGIENVRAVEGLVRQTLGGRGL